MEIVRWGIVGAGRIAHTFCKDMCYTTNARVDAIGSRTLQSAEEFAKQHSIAKAYGDYETLFKDPNIDAIYIATPHNLHFAQAQQALANNKHVLCEKPFTVSAQQCSILMEIAKSKQLFLMEAIWTYFLPAIKLAKRWVDEGRIGKLVRISGDFGYPVAYDPDKREYAEELHGGCLLEMGIYPLAFAQLFAEQAPTDVQVLARSAPNGVEDDLVIMANYQNFNASLGTSFRARLPNWGYVIGTNGYIAIKDFFRASECELHVLDDKVEHFFDRRKGSGFEFQIQSVSQSILEGKLESTAVPLATSLSLQQQMEHILAKC